MNPHLEVRDFRFFLALAEELHFRRAAERLHVAQPHLSAHIRQLEQRLGLLLFERTSRSVKLTAAGEQFEERARFILNHIEQVAVAARRAAQGSQGKIRIAFATAAGFQILPWILAEYRKRHPLIDIELKTTATDVQIKALIAGSVDVGFVRSTVHTKQIETIVLGQGRMVVALPNSHHLARQKSLTMSDLSSEVFVGLAPGSSAGLQERIVGYCHSAGFEPVFGAYAGDIYSISALVAAGFGVAILPEWVSGSRHSQLVFRLLRDAPLADIALAWLAGNQSVAIAGFCEIARLYAAANPLRESDEYPCPEA
jgi:DNA-binding transcriptional LysR family regulator